jgi:hypothetical protein
VGAPELEAETEHGNGSLQLKIGPCDGEPRHRNGLVGPWVALYVQWGYSLDAGCHDLAGLVAPARRPLPGPWLACRWAGQLSASVQRDRLAKPVQARQPASSEYPNYVHFFKDLTRIPESCRFLTLSQQVLFKEKDIVKMETNLQVT